MDLMWSSFRHAATQHDLFRRLFWTISEQSVVSACAFSLQLILARKLSPESYGVFALVLGGIFGLQIFNLALIFHPMSVRVSAAHADERPVLLGSSLILLLLSSVGLSAVLGASLCIVRRPDLIFPAVSFFLLWQTQEGFRRGLLYSFRHGAAIIGDVITYGGPVLFLLGLIFYNRLNIDDIFYGMIIFAALGAAAHRFRLRIDLPNRRRFTEITRDYWEIGGIASLANATLQLARLSMLPWTLATISGPAAAGAFQAAMNVLNLTNPLVLGLSNILPQAAASAAARGNAQSWRLTRSYALAAAPPLVIYFAVVAASPGEILTFFYGSDSHYVHLAIAVRLLVLVSLTTFLTETVISYLHGVTSVAKAMSINFVGTAASVMLSIPLVLWFGLVGGCLALLLANFARLAVVRVTLARVTAAA